MPDEIDVANEQAERWLNQALSSIGKGQNKLVPKGRCYFCDTEFEAGSPDADKKLFCDSDCSQDYEHEKKMKSRR